MIYFEKWFYETMLWFMEFELAVAKSTGRNPDHVRTLRLDVARITSLVDRLEVNCGN
jgi:hypothetical protein